MIKTEEKYTLRKSKKYKNLVSVGLGLATAVAIGMATDNEAFASESGINPATNNKEIQSQANSDQKLSLQNENKSDGSVKVTVNSSELQQAVSEATKQGVKVVAGETKDLGLVESKEELELKRKEIAESYKKQLKKVEEVTTGYVKSKEEHKNLESKILQENSVNKENYDNALKNYEKEKAEKELLNKNILKENSDIELRNKQKKEDYENSLKDLENKKKENEKQESNESELIVKSGGLRTEKESKVEFKQGERINVEANGNIEVTSTNFYSVTNNWSLDIKLPNSSLKDGGIVDLTFERLNGVLLDNSELKIDGETVGLVKLVEVVKKESQPKTVNDSVEGYNLMHTGKYRLIFNENILKYKNRHITLSGKNVPVYPYYYGKNKDVTQNIYVNDKLVASSSTVIPSQPVEPVIKNVSADINKVGVNIKNDGQISPSNIKYVIYNSTPNQLNRGTRIEVGDIITFKLDNNSPIKYNPDSIRERLNSLFWTPARNEGKNMNLAGTVVNQDIVPKYDLLKATETEVSFVIKEVPKDSAFHLNVELGFGSAKITSFNKADYLSSKTYRQELNIKSANGVEKYKTVINQSIGISGANIDAVGDLKPQNPIDVYKIKINYVDELGNSLKDTYKENNLYYGDKYTVNVPKIKGYNFIQEKDSKILNGVLREDKEYTLVYKKLNDIVEINPPVYEELKPILPLPEKPLEPVYKDVPKPPTTPELEVINYTFSEKISVEKQAKNNDNVNIDKKLVNKMSEVKFELKTEKLSAGREKLNIFEITDNLPQGYVLNYNQTLKDNSLYEVVYNKENHTLLFRAKQELLDKYNENLSKDVDAINPLVSGTVVNDGAIYRNNFKLNLNNKYKKYSNTVEITTPGTKEDPNNPSNNLIKPEKHNYNKDGVLIDGKQVERGSVNYYKLVWDLDQYKGIKSTKEDIKKGFYFVDDYPEEALELLEKDVKIVDSNNNEVKGITVKSYESLDKSPKEVQEMLKKAGITPKGAYQLFTVDNPEEFFEKYVVKGNSIHITSPMKVKEDFNSNGGKYENKAYQIDFGNGYESEVVVNNVPKKEQPSKPEQPKEKEKPKEKTLPKTSAVKENSQGYNNMLSYILMTLLTFVLGFFGIKRKVK